MSMNIPPEQIAQMREQLRVITFIHGQKQALMLANAKMKTALRHSMEDLSAVFTVPVIDAYVNTIQVQDEQLSWEIDNLERDIEKLTEILNQIDSPIHRVTAMPVPVPPGPRNIR